MYLSIVIPVYNGERSLERAIRSALDQKTNFKYEVLILNNASTDSTASIISSFSKNNKLKIFTNKRTVSMYENHNLCIKKAKGDYLLFLHYDDFLLPNTVDIICNKLIERNFPDNYILWGRSLYLDYNTTFGYDTIFKSNKDVLTNFIYCGLTPSGTTYSKNLFNSVSLFPVLKERAAASDWAILLYSVFQDNVHYEQTNNLLFVRIESSTASQNSSLDDVKCHLEALEWCLSKLDKDDQSFLLYNIVKYNKLLSKTVSEKYNISVTPDTKKNKISLLSLLIKGIKFFTPYGIIKLIQNSKH